MRRRFTLNKQGMPTNEIWFEYLLEGEEMISFSDNPFNVPIIMLSKNSGKGIIKCSGTITSINNTIFSDACKDYITSVSIPNSIALIGYNAFAYCSSLASVNIPNSVATIGDYAFYDCTSLASVNIPNSVTMIGEQAFWSCTSLTSVTIPNSVTMIGGRAFAYCRGLKEFNGKFASEDGRCLIIDGVLTFFAPYGLIEYTIPDSVTTIEYWAFAYCSSLASVNIPNSVATIGEQAFRNCASLTSVNIGDGVTKFGDWAFAFCTSLTSVYCKAITPPVLGGTDVFYYNHSGRKIYVPTGSVNAYKSDWRKYANYIQGYDF